MSNANLKATILDLLDMKAVDPLFAGEAEAVPLSVSVAQVYMGVRPGETIPEVADILFSLTLVPRVRYRTEHNQ